MLAVIVCSLCDIAMLIGLVAGIVVGFWRGRASIADALAYDSLDVRPRTTAARAAPWHPA